ncbi:TPA: hypothetical protein DDX46_00375 [Candidatus Saccharibacteria bacterium]|nr:MAG: hypothetical protein A3E20_02760 [Candidatus Saccharibacteria bacterium RIFCSPHIGHO2_12_FULL_47_16]HBH77189.1 hypothetical protein [Candidatus Saccharibacteria bacterium]
MLDKLPIKRQRILALDLLRGLFLLIILADHLRWAPSFFFQFATAYTGMVASAAEGFFIISGILVGYIYGPRILHSTRRTTLKIWKRAFLLYALAVSFTLLYSLWASFLPEGYSRSSTLLASSVGDAILGALSLTYTYGWADFLSRYAVFMLAAPLTLWLIAKRKAYIVLIVSGLIWLLFREVTPWLIFAAWQVIFFAGVVIGYYLPKIESEAKKTNNRKCALKLLVYISVTSFILTAIFIAIPPLLLLSFDTIINNDVTNILNRINGVREHILIYFDKSTMSVCRLTVGALWFVGLYTIFRKHEIIINKRSRGILLLLGQYSLFVYSTQAFLIFTIDTFLPTTSGPNPPFILLNTLFGILSATLIYIITKLYAKRTTVYTRLRQLLA